MNLATSVRKPVTMEEYLVYKALKEDKVPIVGYETPSRQFNVMAKVGSMEEAIKTVLGANDVQILANALGTFELETEVKSALEHEVLKGIIELGKTTKAVGAGGFDAGLVSMYGLTPELMDATRRHGVDFPLIIEEVAKFLLYDKHCPLPEYRVGWTLHPEYVISGIEILRGISKSDSVIAQEVRKAVQGRSGAYHTVKRYIGGIRPLRDCQDEVYRSVLGDVIEVLTPELLTNALREIRFLREEYEQQKPATEGTYYSNLKQAKEYVDSGDYESMSPLRDGHPDAEPKTYLNSLNERIRGIEAYRIEEVARLANSFKEQISPLVVTLEDLRSDFGPDEFKRRGYIKIQEEISGLAEEVEELRHYTVKKWSSIKQKLTDEKKARTATKLPWYMRILHT